MVRAWIGFSFSKRLIWTSHSLLQRLPCFSFVFRIFLSQIMSFYLYFSFVSNKFVVIFPGILSLGVFKNFSEKNISFIHNFFWKIWWLRGCFRRKLSLVYKYLPSTHPLVFRMSVTVFHTALAAKMFCTSMVANTENDWTQYLHLPLLPSS